MNENKEEFKIITKIKYLIEYSDTYILCSFPKTEMTLKIKYEDNLYNLLENTYRANINRGSIRIKYIKELLVNIYLIDYYIGRIKDKKIIKTNRYSSVLNCTNEIFKMLNGWLKYEETK